MGKLDEGIRKLGFKPTGEQERLLKQYIEELERWNPLYSLVNATGDDLIIRHILDSLSALAQLSLMPGRTMADMGSGGGLPGIPLAIFMPSWEIHLVERSGKRCDFLNNVVLLLGLDNVTVQNRELKQVKEKFDLITFRAFRPFEPDIVKGLKKCLQPQGTIAAYKGRKSSIEEEMNLLKDQFSSLTTLTLTVPFLNEERHLLLLK